MAGPSSTTDVSPSDPASAPSVSTSHRFVETRDVHSAVVPERDED
jgi:hypothetical protein